MTHRLYFARSASATARRMGLETLVMSAPNSTLLTLNEVASLLWEAADGVTALDHIVANTICNRFDVELETALLDAEVAVKNLAEKGVLELSDYPIPKHESRL